VRRELLDETQSERVAVGLASLNLRESDDREDDTDDVHGRDDEQADEDEGQDVSDDLKTKHRDLEVQGFLRLNSGLGAAVLEDQEDDERRQDAEDTEDVRQACIELVVSLVEGGRGCGGCVSHCVVAFQVNEVVVPGCQGVALCRAVAAAPGTRGVREHRAKVAPSRVSMQ
jgi:hypothetical protein